MTEEERTPVLFGWNVLELWEYIHPVALAGWAVLCIAPRWKPTFSVVTLVPPLIHAILYTSILMPIMLFPDPNEPVLDLADMNSVMAVFQKRNVFFCGWVHYLTFDLLVGRGIAMDAIQVCQVSHIQYYALVVPCLLATLYVGPVGFLLYCILRGTRVLRPAQEERVKLS